MLSSTLKLTKEKFMIFREEATSGSVGFHADFLYPDRTGIWRCWVLWREKNRRPGEKFPGQDENDNPHMAPGRNRTRIAYV